MAKPLATPLGNLQATIKKAVCRQSDVKLAEIRGRLESLSERLDEIAVVEAEKWKQLENDVFSILIADKSYSTDSIKAHRRRMMLIERYMDMVLKHLGMISAAKDLIEYEKTLQNFNRVPATMSSLRKAVSKAQARLNEWKEQMEGGLTIDSMFGAMETQIEKDAFSESERKALELWDRYETCLAAGDDKGAKAAQEAIYKLSGAERAVR